MIQTQLKFRMKPKVILNKWLWVLTRVWNGAIRNVELEGRDGIYYSKKPRLKGIRNCLNSSFFPNPIRCPDGVHIKIPGSGIPRFYKQDASAGKIQCGRMVRRALVWYLCLFIEAGAKTIPLRSNCVVGIDPGDTSTLTGSSEEKIDQEKQLQRAEKCLLEAQQGKSLKRCA